MYIPDLFGAYVRGREYAIDRNWNDLKQYEAVEAARNMNDQTALDLLKQRAQFGGELAMFQHNVDASGRANEVGEYMQPGLVASADSRSMGAQDARGAYLNNRGAYQQAANAVFLGNVGQQQLGADALIAKNETLAPHAGQLGVWAGESALNTARGNSILAGHQPYRAEQQNAAWERAAALDQLGDAARMANYQFEFGLLPTVQDTARYNVQAENAYARNAPAREEATRRAEAELQLARLYDGFTTFYNAYLTTKSPADLAAAQRYAAQIESITGQPVLPSPAPASPVAPPLAAAQNPSPPVATIPQPANATLLPQSAGVQALIKAGW